MQKEAPDLEGCHRMPCSHSPVCLHSELSGHCVSSWDFRDTGNRTSEHIHCSCFLWATLPWDFLFFGGRGGEAGRERDFIDKKLENCNSVSFMEDSISWYK